MRDALNTDLPQSVHPALPGLANRADIESVLWIMHHSHDRERLTSVFGTYLDESATDGGTPTAVVAGLLLSHDEFTWLDVEWEKAARKYGLLAIHMKDFGKGGKLKDFPEEDRRGLFTLLAKIINDHKGWSVAYP
jgi:hypothetical protein